MRKALVVGITNYQQAPLRTCCDDANAIESLLKRNEDGSSNFETRIMNNLTTKSELKRQIKKCFDGDADVALFYFSGHGYIDSVGGYLVTPDFSEDEPGVSLQEILTIVNASKCKEKVIILDSCFSGFMGTANVVDETTAVIKEGVTILTASRKEEVAIELNGHGLFTALLLEALKGGAADVTGNITPGGIYAYIDKALGPWSQRPVFKTNVTRFTSLRNVVPQVELSIIRRLCTYFPNETDEVLLDPSFEPTNSPSSKHTVLEPYADDKNVKVFSDLQALEGVGLVVPIGEKHMYYAAMKSKSCALTPIGRHYWRLVRDNRI